jgi:hypothetical protein
VSAGWSDDPPDLGFWAIIEKIAVNPGQTAEVTRKFCERQHRPTGDNFHRKTSEGTVIKVKENSYFLSE